MSSVDDSETFLRMMKRSYAKYDELERDFREFQYETYSSFYKYESKTSEKWSSENHGKVPSCFPYYRVKFCCVHKRRKTKEAGRYINHACPAFINVCAVGGKYRVTRWSMVHNHTFHLGDRSLYVRNRRLTTEQESQIYQMINNSGSIRAVRAYALDIFGRNLTSHDVRSIKQRWSHRNNTDDTLEAHNLRGHGILRIIRRGGSVHCVFFVPHYVKTAAEQYFDVILTDTTTHEIPYSGFLLWHAMFINETGLGRSFFYAIVPNDKVINYQKAISFMRERIPQTVNCKTIIVDRKLAQSKVITHIYPTARVLVSHFSLLADVGERCELLQGVSPLGKQNIMQWVKNMTLSRTELEFDDYRTRIANRSPEMMTYLNQTWLPCVNLWSFYANKGALVMDSFFIDRVKIENQQLRKGLHSSSTLSNISAAILRRVDHLNDTSRVRLDEELSRKCKIPPEFVWLRPVLVQLRRFARDAVLHHVRRHEIPNLSHHEQYSVVRCARCGVIRVTLGSNPRCECTFYKQWMLPCAHLLHATQFIGSNLDRLVSGRWNPVVQAPVPEHVEPDPAPSAPQSIKSESNPELPTSTAVIDDLTLVLNQLKSDHLKNILPQMQKLSEVLRINPNIQIFCRPRGGNALVPLSSDTQVNKIFTSESRDMEYSNNVEQPTLTSERLPELTSNSVPESTSEKSPELTQERLPALAPETLPESTTVRLPAFIPEELPEHEQHTPTSPVVMTTSCKRKDILTHRETLEMDFGILHIPHPRRPQTNRYVRVRRRQIPPRQRSLCRRVCSVCSRTDVSIDLDQEITWVQCGTCKQFVHYECTICSSGTNYYCVNCLNRMSLC
ncbi:hypothetical protein FGIG_08441 [Fasciola gigantica]|uniref:SWIM-type domain-containing protein n=1 Tax=Fasciola gigantica TaxID=46835 RepID=A0A504YRH0_FASGI|nr:hypothetical protein FGIG_08441 [Fasciola gigantica]